MARERITREDVIAADAAQALGIAIAWAGIAAVNFSFGRRRG